MPRRAANLCSTYLDLVSRYGEGDPLVRELKLSMDLVSASPQELPHGERRKVSLPRADWIRLRPPSLTRRLGVSAKAALH